MQRSNRIPLFGSLVTALERALFLWQREQGKVSEWRLQREQLFRDHRSFDQLTQVAGADYLRERLRIEYERGSHSCCLLMLDIDGFHQINRDHGRPGADRAPRIIVRQEWPCRQSKFSPKRERGASQLGHSHRVAVQIT